MLTTVLLANLTFQVVEYHSFRKLLSIARPGIDVVNRRCLRQLLNDRYTKVTDGHLQGLGPTTKVLLAIDCWTSPNQKAFVAIVAYYISESWKYKKVLLEFEPISGPHTGRNLTKVVEGVLLQYGIADRLFAITTDNTPNNSTLRDSLEQALTGHHGISWSADMTKINCLAHVLNLSAKALLLSVKVAENGDTPDSQHTPSTSPDDLEPEAAEDSVARTVVKVSCQF